MHGISWDHYEQMLRVRAVDAKGNMVSLGREKEGDVYWAELYDGRSHRTSSL